MSINFKEEMVRVEYLIGEDTVRESITQEVEIPVAAKPDIERILEVKTQLRNIEYMVEDGGVTIDGVIDIGVMYVAETVEGDQPVHFFEGEITFSNFVEIPEAEADMSAFADVHILRASYDVVDERTLRLTVIIRKFAKVFDYRQINIITDVTGIRKDLVEKELLRIENVVAEDVYQVIVGGIVDVPDRKPDIERVLKVTGGLVEADRADVTDDGVIIDGVFEGGVMYVAETVEGDQPVHFAEGRFDFSEVVDLPGVDEGMAAFTNIRVKRWDYTVRAEGRQVEVRAVIEVFVKVTEPKQMKVVTNILSDKVEVEEKLLRVEEVIGENTVTETITENLIVPDVKPDIERILEANAQLFDPTGTVEEGGVLIEATIEGSVLYVAATVEGDQPVHYFRREIDFSNFVSVPGAEPGMSSYINVILKRIRANRLGPRTVELSLTLSKFAKVTNFRQLTIVTDIVVVSPIVDKPVCDRPSRVVYVVQPGDTLYKIARRYRTTIDAIVDANNLVNPDYLEVGQKLVIPKCIIDKPKG
ncbi:DUF3794 and LysM peptidoglycan-binding domain-containing protein [Halonatronum saccharophilum]|uniref:DUF3794 and LysM peptidoglycan-binding domain-containing protein n=1 Tax=Halonatronum saccharophilum TaxID=150060 RepID=UPI000486ABAB|nr:SPOCS domain-containing protein [Halonatronum saccharophilum]